MEQRCDEPKFGIPQENWYDIKVQGDFTVFGKEIHCRNLVIEGDFILVGNLFCNDIDIKGNCRIYGNIYSCEKVKVQGDFYIYTISESLMDGGFFGPYGDVEIGGDLICGFRVRASRNKIKVGGDFLTRDVECGAISVAGDFIAYPGGIDSDETVYVLGNITTGYPIEAEKVYCGGKYTRIRCSEKEISIIHENVKYWHNLT